MEDKTVAAIMIAVILIVAAWAFEAIKPSEAKCQEFCMNRSFDTFEQLPINSCKWPYTVNCVKNETLFGSPLMWFFHARFIYFNGTWVSDQYRFESTAPINLGFRRG